MMRFVKKGIIINIKGSNIAYVSPHIMIIKGNNYLLFNDLDDYIFNYRALEKEYEHSQKVVDNLEECEKLEQENNNLIDFIKNLLQI